MTVTPTEAEGEGRPLYKLVNLGISFYGPKRAAGRSSPRAAERLSV
jgi:hypothetical protein